MGTSIPPRISAWGLGGKLAFGGQNAGFTDMAGNPGYLTTTADLGTTYAGKTVQVRFRGAMDDFTGYSGWFVQQVVFQGIQNTPFAGRIADRGICVAPPQTGIVITASSDTTTVPSGYLVQLSAATTQDAGQPVSFTWSQVSGPPVTLSSQSGANVHFNAPAVTTQTPIVLQAVGSDGTLQSSPQQVTINVVPVGGPVPVSSGCSYGGPLPDPAAASALSGLLLAGAALLARRRRR